MGCRAIRLYLCSKPDYTQECIQQPSRRPQYVLSVVRRSLPNLDNCKPLCTYPLDSNRQYCRIFLPVRSCLLVVKRSKWLQDPDTGRHATSESMIGNRQRSQSLEASYPCMPCISSASKSCMPFLCMRQCVRSHTCTYCTHRTKWCSSVDTREGIRARHTGNAGTLGRYFRQTGLNDTRLEARHT